ncbi:hypothetical protein [Clostridium botulinum]|uniref:hypothetical protein n=1 Tax=Clostridium botulinum TaxID=1491 RepID=UPI0021BE165A|nr:hypothetical protein [Clostridium botulinum]
MRTSTNYNLKLMEGTDNVKRQDFVDNFEIIDREMKNNDTSLKDIANDSYPIVEATGTNSYIGSSARITSLNKGTRCTLFVGSNAIGNCSLNLNNYGAKNIKDSFGNIVNNLKANIPYNLCYNGSDFILQGKGGGGNATADKLLSGSTATVDSGPITGTMPNQGSKTASLNCGGSYIIPAGYHNGSGKVAANSLASQTSATATTAQILSGFTAWVNGNKITGKATIENLGGTNKKSGTLTMNKETTINIQLGFKPNFVLVKSTNYSLKSTCFLHITNANFSWVYPGTYWIYGSGPSNDNFAIRYSENNELYFGIVPNDTGFNLSYNKGDNSTTVSYVACIL